MSGAPEEPDKRRRPKRPRSPRPLRGSLLHVDLRGRARMVDVGGKATTARRATARGRVRLNAAAFDALSEGRLSKGDARRSPGWPASGREEDLEIFPLAHPVGLDVVRWNASST